MKTWRADVVGSLLRPEYLARAQQALADGRMSTAEFKRVEDRAVDQAVALQEGAGVDVVTDGEMRRIGFADQLWSAVDGLEAVPESEAASVPFHGARAEDDLTFAVPARVVERIRRRRMMTVEEYSYVRGQARVPVKATLPSPLMLFLLWSQQHSRPAYRDAFELFADGVTLIREEAAELAALGCRYIQIDSPDLGQLADPDHHADWEARGIAPERALSEGVDMVNAVADVPRVTFALHLCKGNFRSRWISKGGYETLSKQVFSRIGNYERVMLEYDDERSGTFEPLADLPDDKVAVLGLVSTKHDDVEKVDDLADRMSHAARYFPKDQLAVSTQCGFASIAVGNDISTPAQEAKLRLVSDVAERIWS
ncbi:MAG: methionine synthase [Pseudonocardiaceae bacterium]|nr:methionine synthase [Pseudonocardiaceae bacterium]